MMIGENKKPFYRGNVPFDCNQALTNGWINMHDYVLTIEPIGYVLFD